MPWTLERSNLHFERAIGRLPLGVASGGGYLGDGRTVYVKRAAGARLWDIDDNEYIDYRLGRGQAILGYADRRVARAARAGIGSGGVFALAMESELAVAERIARLVPGAELVRFSNSGAEAVVDAWRLARDVTRKDGLAVVEGGSNAVLGTRLSAAGHQSRRRGADSSGAPPRARNPFDALIHATPANDANRFEDLLRRRGDDIGAFLIEPISIDRASIAADAAYLADVRALCDRFEILLIIDETTAGFRVARGGAQEMLGVRADLCIFGASMANGLPIAALAGREAILRRFGDGGVHGCAYAAHPVSLAAADKTLEIVERTDAVEQIARYGWRMREGMGQVLSRRGIPHAFVGPPSMSGLRFGESPNGDGAGRDATDDAFCTDLVPRLLASGVLCDPDLYGPWFVSAAHNELCLAETLAKFEHAVDAALEQLPGARGRSMRRDGESQRSFATPG